ncbi:site-specific integrase [Biformimicrobium ophioploci]|uniref:Tyr recombinase domain-containing protein n=1 Tax=Biformimicrobium ophioploci TaxID=3036711 RepID=A0ABQ6LY28_9GAMM|nr:site-specific integrase [Microbulbifer sp. NKW57]GMG86974.1 hypothetical protein MNKW57_12950 [Microbulbifer sp. NKW57]
MAGFAIMKIHQRKNGYWYVRKRVPDAVREIIGKSEFLESLKTKNKAEAAALAPQVIAEIDKKIAEARLKLQPKRHDSLKLKPKDHHVLADMCIAYQIEQMEDADHIVDYVSYLHDLTPDMAPSKKAADRLLLDFLTAKKIALSPKSKGFADVSKVIVSKWDSLLFALTHRGADKWTTPADISLNAEHLSDAARLLVDDALTISELYEQYKAEEFAYNPESKKAALAKRFRDLDQVSRWFIEHLGDDVPVQQVTKQQVGAFITKMGQRPKTKKPNIKALPLSEQIQWAKDNDQETVALTTTQKDVKLFQSVFSFAVDKHYLNSNPFSGALRRVDRHVAKAPAKKTGYSAADLKKAFGSVVFSERYKPSRKADIDYGLATFWIPLIAYYTGARLNEIVQLHLVDVREEDGIWCFDISPNDTDKRTKNGKARLVPVHKHLIDLGFLEYIEEGKRQHKQHKTATSHRVFSMLQPNKDGDLSSGISKILGRRLKQAGITSGIQPMHGFRHYIKTVARRMGVAEDVHDAITGHSGTSVGRGYGGIETDTANAVIQKIDRAKIPVSHFRNLED